jgi:hypothetical protein
LALSDLAGDLSPRSWQGWLVVAIWLPCWMLSLSVWHSAVAAIACLAGLAVTLLVSSDRPGGPGSVREPR